MGFNRRKMEDDRGDAVRISKRLATDVLVFEDASCAERRNRNRILANVWYSYEKSQ